jgi:cell wall-active antibiotic response 4TMS protein YvqF
MSDRIQCHCPRCTIRGLRNPAVIITIGVLFLLQETRGGYFDFSRTFPVILVVIGAILLASSLAPTDGHISSALTPPAGPGPTPGAPQNTFPGQGQ